MTSTDDTRLITTLNFMGCLVAYVMLGLSLWLSPDVPLATKGYWGIAVLMLTISLVNFVKYRFDARLSADRVRQIEEARGHGQPDDRVGADKTG